jgi:phosphoribosylglycinamide formyltransferase-1
MKRRPRPLRIGALISGSGTNLQAVIDACRDGRVDGRVVFTGSDRPSAAGLERAREGEIPTFVVDYAEIIRGYRQAPDDARLPPDFDLAQTAARQRILPRTTASAHLESYLKSRAIAEAHLLDEMARHPYDLLILAGFMRNLTPYFIDRVSPDPDAPRIMNIHPALLPAFPGTDGYGDTFRYGCKIGGCTVHFVDYGEDSGPIIGQRAFAIDPRDSLEDVRRKGLQLEWMLYPACVQLFAEGRLKIARRPQPAAAGRLSSKRVVEILPA